MGIEKVKQRRMVLRKGIGRRDRINNKVHIRW